MMEANGSRRVCFSSAFFNQVKVSKIRIDQFIFHYSSAVSDVWLGMNQSVTCFFFAETTSNTSDTHRWCCDTQHYLFHAQHLGDRFVNYSGVKSLLFGCQRSVNNDLLLRRNLKCHVCLQPPQQEWSQDLK